MNLVRKRIELPVLPSSTEVLHEQNDFKKAAKKQDPEIDTFVRRLRYKPYENEALMPALNIAAGELRRLACLCSARLVEVTYCLYNTMSDSVEPPLENEDPRLLPEGFNLVGKVKIVPGFTSFDEPGVELRTHESQQKVRGGILTYIESAPPGSAYVGDSARLDQFGEDMEQQTWLIDPDPVLWMKNKPMSKSTHVS